MVLLPLSANPLHSPQIPNWNHSVAFLSFILLVFPRSYVFSITDINISFLSFALYAIVMEYLCIYFYVIWYNDLTAISCLFYQICLGPILSDSSLRLAHHPLLQCHYQYWSLQDPKPLWSLELLYSIYFSLPHCQETFTC